jgi:hypothetical protein
MKRIDGFRKCLTENLLPTVLVLTTVVAPVLAQADAKPKYGPEALVLSAPHGHDYFRTHAAPDFWAMMPFYAAQIDNSACSVASIQMLVNAARGDQKLTADDELATQPKLVEKVKNKAWHRGVPGVLAGKGVSLDELGDLAREALEAYGMKVATVVVTHATDTSPPMRAKLEQALAQNEKSNDDFILINFNQAVYTGDAEVGHIAPIAAYDATHHRVLVLDPDRQWYEPYWVSTQTLLAGMATKDSQSAQNRGWVYIKLMR